MFDLALRAYADATKPRLGGTIDQRKLARLRDMAEAYLASPGAPIHHGRVPTVNVTIDLPTLLGMRDNPAEIPGIGPIPAAAARWLLAEGAPLRRPVIDPMSGHLLDYGTTTYTVPADLADYLIALNVTSGSPNSQTPAAGCDMEHNTPYHQGTHQPSQRHPRRPPMAPTQNPRPLDLPQTPRRHHHLDQPHRTHRPNRPLRLPRRTRRLDVAFVQRHVGRHGHRCRATARRINRLV